MGYNASDQPAGVVAAHGTSGQPGADPLCVFALDCYLDTLGQEAANMAMRFLARGGVFIAGGTSKHIPSSPSALRLV